MSPSSLARSLFLILLVLAFLYLPGGWLWVLAFVGALVFPFYIEGVLLFLGYQILSATPAPWFDFWVLSATVALILGLKLGSLLRPRLFWSS